MKYLKLFNDTASYEAWKNGEKYVRPNVVFNEETGLVYEAYVEPTSPNVVCVYDVTDISYETKLTNSYGGRFISSMIVDGVEMEFDTYYQFDTIGEHTVEFVLNDDIDTLTNEFISSSPQLVSVSIPDSVTSIGKGTFSSCERLTEFKGNFAEDNGRLLVISNKIISFAPYGISEYTIPYNITSIGANAFSQCYSLTEVTIPNSVISIENGAFGGCTGKLNINCNIPSGSSQYSRPFNCNFNSITIGDSVTSIGDYAFYNSTSLTEITIPNSVTSIGDRAFSGCTGKLNINCNIPSGSSSGGGSFFDHNFNSITIGDSVTSIGDYAFYSNSSLTEVTIGDSVTSIGDYAFSYNRSLTEVTIPNSVQSIGQAAFYECISLTEVTIPNSVISIENGAFGGCTGKLNINCNIPSGDRDHSPFHNCKFNSITIGDSVTSIGDYAFYNNTSLTEITIGSSVQSIGQMSLYGCKSLREVTIPDSVKYIYGYAFYNNTSLISVYCKAITPPQPVVSGSWDTFKNNASGRKIYVPMESVESYKSAMFWGDYSNDIVGYNF